MTRHSWLLVLVFAAPVAAQPAAPEFLAQTIEGTSRRGPLERLGEGWAVRLGGTAPGTLEPDELLALRRSDRVPPPQPVGEQAVLVNGDRIPGTVGGMSGERVLFRLRPELGVEKEARLPLAAIALLWFAAPEDEENPGRLMRQLLADTRSRDLVLLRNGDRIEGILAGIDSRTGVELEVNRRTVTVDRDKVAAIALTTDLGGIGKPRGSRARLILADGTRLTLASPACIDGKTLTGTTVFGVEVRIALTDLIALEVLDGRVVYLSDLKPKRYDFTPALDVHWPFIRDGSVVGDALRLGGGTYDRGLGMHSASRLSFDLGGNYRRFEALVGLDDRTGRGGSVRVGVLVDGKPRDLGTTGDLTAKNGPLPIRVDVRGARELTLVVEFGRRLDVEDHVNWADARLIK